MRIIDSPDRYEYWYSYYVEYSYCTRLQVQRTIPATVPVPTATVPILLRGTAMKGYIRILVRVVAIYYVKYYIACYNLLTSTSQVTISTTLALHANGKTFGWH